MPHNTPYEIFADCRCTVGEGPVWSSAEEILYWIDIVKGVVFRKGMDTGCNNYECFQLDIGKIGGITLAENGSFLLFAEKGKVWKWWPGLNPQLYTELDEASESRFNDVIAGDNGQVYCGVAPKKNGETGSLWRMNADKSFLCIEREICGMPNGMGFSPDRRYFYFTVSDEKVIYRYNYDNVSGNITGRHPMIVTADHEGVPDGMTVDSAGCLWSAQWNGSRLIKYSPEGKVLRVYNFPIAKITSVVKVENMMFVTTANYPWKDDDYLQTGAGSVLRIELK